MAAMKSILLGRYLGLAIFFGFIIFDRLKFSVDGVFSLKPFIAIALGVIFWGLLRKLLIPKGYAYFVVWFCSLLIPLVGGTVISYDQFAVILFGHALLTIFYLCFYNLMIYKRWSVVDIVDSLIYLGCLSSLVALLQVILFFLGVDTSVTHFENVGVPRAESLFSETDWHSMFVGYVLLLSFFIGPMSRFFLIKKLVIGFLAFSLFLSFGRTAIIGVIFCLIVYGLIFVKFKKMLTGFLVGGFLALPVFFIGYVLLPDAVLQRFDIIGNINDSSLDAGALNSRIFALNMAFDYIKAEPIWGNGAGSINYLANDEEIKDIYAYGGGINSGRGGTNIFVTSLFDSGFVGLLVIIIFLGKLISLSYFQANKNHDNYDSFFKFCFLGFLYFLIECQSNNMIRTPICWLHFAFFSYAVFLRRHGLPGLIVR